MWMMRSATRAHMFRYNKDMNAEPSSQEKGGRGILGEVPRLVGSSSFLHQFCCWSLAFFSISAEGGGGGRRERQQATILCLHCESCKGNSFPLPSSRGRSREEESGKRKKRNFSLLFSLLPSPPPPPPSVSLLFSSAVEGRQ